jgi:hypothetical protein
MEKINEIKSMLEDMSKDLEVYSKARISRNQVVEG